MDVPAAIGHLQDAARSSRGAWRGKEETVLSERQWREASGIGLLALGVLLAVAILQPFLTPGDANAIGPAGALLHRWGTAAFGPSAVLVALPALAWGVHLLGAAGRSAAVRWTVLGGGLLFLAPGAIALLVGGAAAEAGAAAEGPAGRVGELVAEALVAGFGPVGGAVMLLSLLLALSVLGLGWSPLGAAAGARRAAAWIGRALGTVCVVLWRGARELWADPGSDATPWEARGGAPEAPAETATPANGGPPASAGEKVPLFDPGDLEQTELPPVELLTLPSRRTSGLDERALRALGEVLIRKLATFRVEGEIGGWTTGPVVTQFEVVPAPGVKVGQIAARADDLALALRAPSVRIVAPIPGKGAVGVEVPNPEPEIVHLREILESPVYRRSRAELPLALGRDLSGRPQCADLARMPHLLIAGATGTGKSVCINAIITSLAYRYTPRELRLLMVDPKMVELSVYGDLPHLRHPVVTDNEEAASVLKWAVFEMKRRFELLSANACRNLGEFNRRVRDGSAVRPRSGDGPEDREYEEGELPYVVLVIDELADLMMTVQSEVETPLAMLAQKARAVGIHLVVATQRPSVNVITGLIKANFPSRIAFRVASKTDSRTILDQNGAESLLGNGDMLFLPPGEADPVRIQGAFVSSGDTERLLEWYRSRAAVREAAEPDILELVREMEEEEARVDVAEEVLEDRDELFRQAAEIVITHDSGSTSLLQRRLKIGYGRAARIIDQLHHAGIVGPAEGSKPREILVSLDQLDQITAGG